MANFSVPIIIDDDHVAATIAAMQLIDPKYDNETDAEFVTRIAKDLFSDYAFEAVKRATPAVTVETGVS